jgi:hypothetical protein
MSRTVPGQARQARPAAALVRRAPCGINRQQAIRDRQEFDRLILALGPLSASARAVVVRVAVEDRDCPDGMIGLLCDALNRLRPVLIGRSI